MMWQNLIFSILILPLVCAFFSGLVGYKLGSINFFYCYVFFYTFFFFIFFYFFLFVNNYSFVYYLNLLTILNYKGIVFNLDFLFDYLNITMLFIVFTISFFVNLFSIWYMWKDPNIFKFITFLNFFSLFMFLLIVSNNLIFVFVGWEGIGLFSYLLINFWKTRANANRSALKAIFINKIGDIFFYFFIFLYFFIFETFNIFETKILICDYLNLKFISDNKNIFFFLSFFLIIACMAKSAQIFFHVWLPDAMEGPTPVSALLHAATMVTAGIFILIKFSWLIFLDLNLCTMILFVGILTNFLASLVSIFQNDIKKIVAYSTSSQLGLIFISFGILRSDLAFFHIFNHAFFKALLFILSGVIIHIFNNKQDYRYIKNFDSKFYYIYIYALLSFFTLIGMPYLSAFYSKEIIIQSSFLNLYLNSSVAVLFLYISVLTTIIYGYKILYFLFYKNANFISYSKDLTYDFKSNYMLFVLLFLSVISIFFGFFYKIICCSSFIKTFCFVDPFLKVELEKWNMFSILETSFIFIIFIFTFTFIIIYYKIFFINNFIMFNNFFRYVYYIFNKKFIFDSLYYYFTFFFFNINYVALTSFDKFFIESSIRKLMKLFLVKNIVFNLNSIKIFFFVIIILILNLFLFNLFNLWYLYFFLVFLVVYVTFILLYSRA